MIGWEVQQQHHTGFLPRLHVQHHYTLGLGEEHLEVQHHYTLGFQEEHLEEPLCYNTVQVQARVRVQVLVPALALVQVQVMVRAI